MRSKSFGFLLSAAVILIMVFGMAAQAASAVNYYVAPDGSDSNPGTISQPFRTIQKCATTAVSGQVCQIRQGTYRETVTPNSGVVITAYTGEQVTVDGSDPVTGWTLYQGSIYRASIVLSPGDTNQVFVGQEMMTEARWPNGDDLFHVNWATLKAGTTAMQLIDSSLPNINWTGAKIHFWSGIDPWAPQTGVITAAQTGQLTFRLDGTPYPNYYIPQPNGYYYLFGILAALDTQREWFYDSSAEKLYFWAQAGVNPNTLEVRAKKRQYAFDLSGKSNVTIRNIKLFASSINSDASSTSNTIDGITATYVSHYTTLPDKIDPVTGNPIKETAESDHLYDSGIVITGTGNILQNSTISYSAGNGVTVSGTNNTVQNNLIHHVDYMANEPSGVTFRGTGKILYNTIYSSGRYAIFADSDGSQISGTPLNVDISYNNLYNAMMLSRDGGAIYAMPPTAWPPTATTGSRIHHNWIHDLQSLYSGPGDDYPLSGVYLDHNASGWKVDQNVLWNNQSYNILLHGTPLTPGTIDPNNNIISKNSIIDVGTLANINVGITPNIGILDVEKCGSPPTGTKIIDNRILFSPAVHQGISTDQAAPPLVWCLDINNNETAPGADEMTASVKVGCDFAGCSSDVPPIFSGSSVAASIATQPYDLTVTAGQTATFSVTGAGSAPLSYQWQRNGVNISGATNAIYTTPATTSADNSAAFTVRVVNSVGSIMSSPAILTVQPITSACTYTLSPTSQTLTSAAGTGSVSVTASSSSCAWTATSSLSWVTITSGASGTGSGTVTFTVSANTTGATRTGNITIAGQTFTITQTAVQPVSLTTTSPSSQTYFDTIQAAYNANTAASGSSILAQGVALTETLAFNQNNSITLTGGYDSTFSTVGGTMTTIHGSLTISGGQVTAAYIVIQ